MKILELIAAIYVTSWVLAVIICVMLAFFTPPPEYDHEENHEIN